jgi:alanine racemase
LTDAGVEGHARATAVVDLGAIEHNCTRIVEELGRAELCAVVKADGYGHGAVESASAALAGGATWLAVATADEAAELRAELPDARLLVMGALSRAELDAALDADADVAVWRAGFLDLIRERARALGVQPRLHVKYDSGMGRLGERDEDAVAGLVDEVAAADEVELTGFWTHFATADEPGSAFFDEQLERYTRLAEEIGSRHPGVIRHAANSAATLIEPGSHFDMVRCGIAIYGLDPFQEAPGLRRLEPALSLYSYVADVKRFEAGASAGYGRQWRATEPTWVGVLPIGYGDGVRRALSNNADVLVGGHRRPLVGTVSMDNITIDLGPETDVAAGDPAVLIGHQDRETILCEEVAMRLATINYEVTCGVSARVQRRYVLSGPEP